MNRCNYDCANCTYDDCVKDADVSHIQATLRYNKTHQTQVTQYRKNYYKNHKNQFRLNKVNYMESLNNNAEKLAHYKNIRSEQNKRYRERKRLLCQN